MIEYTCVCKNRNCVLKKIKSCVQRKRDISIVIPSYNEEGNIPRVIKFLKVCLTGKNYEIIVVDDSSTDATPQIINRFAKSDRVIALHRKGIRGIFSAIQDGIRLSRGRIIVFMDADLSHPPGVVPELLDHIKDYDIVSASRFVNNGGIDAPFLRKYGSIVLNKVCRLILGLKIADVTGGFHAMKKSTFNQMKFKYKSIWGEFDLELFYHAKKKKLKIKEVPFTYKFRDEGVSKSENLLKYGIIYLIFATRLRLSER